MRRFGFRFRKQRLRVQHPWHATPESLLLIPAAGRFGSLREFNEARNPAAASSRAWPWSCARHRKRTVAAERQGQGQQRKQQEEQRQRAVSSFAAIAPVAYLRPHQPPGHGISRDIQRYQVRFQIESFYSANFSAFFIIKHFNAPSCLVRVSRLFNVREGVKRDGLTRKRLGEII